MVDCEERYKDKGNHAQEICELAVQESEWAIQQTDETAQWERGNPKDAEIAANDIWLNSSRREHVLFPALRSLSGCDTFTQNHEQDVGSGCEEWQWGLADEQLDYFFADFKDHTEHIALSGKYTWDSPEDYR